MSTYHVYKVFAHGSVLLHLVLEQINLLFGLVDISATVAIVLGFDFVELVKQLDEGLTQLLNALAAVAVVLGLSATADADAIQRVHGGALFRAGSRRVRKGSASKVGEYADLFGPLGNLGRDLEFFSFLGQSDGLFRLVLQLVGLAHHHLVFLLLFMHQLLQHDDLICNSQFFIRYVQKLNVFLELLDHLLDCLLLLLLKCYNDFLLLLALNFFKFLELLFVFFFEELVTLTEANYKLHLRSFAELDEVDVAAVCA